MKRKFEIGIWSSPKNTLNDYLILKQCGMTHAIIDENYCKRMSPEYDKIMQYCDMAKLQAYVLKFNHVAYETFVDTTDYNKYSSFAGFDFFDEPHSKHFDAIAGWIPEFEKNYPDKTFFVNLWPMYANFETCLGTATYEEYCRLFCEKVLTKINGRRLLSVDYYPLVIDENGKTFLEDTWLRNLEITAYLAKEYKADTHYYIQSTSFGLWRRMPEKADFLFQYFVSMAFGVAGISHFTYTSPLGGEFAEKDVALIDRSGVPTERYFHVRDANEQLNSFVDEYMSYTWCGAKAFEGKNKTDIHEQNNINMLKANDYKFKSIVCTENTENLLVGEFERDGGNAYIIVNFTDPSHHKSNQINLKFVKKQAYKYYHNNNIISGDRDSIALTLNAGEGIFLTL